jgi:hypothetical protein
VCEREEGAAAFELTFAEAGEYPYFCLLHPNQVVGMIIVCTKKSINEKFVAGILRPVVDLPPLKL